MAYAWTGKDLGFQVYSIRKIVVPRLLIGTSGKKNTPCETSIESKSNQWIRRAMSAKAGKPKPRGWRTRMGTRSRYLERLPPLAGVGCGRAKGRAVSVGTRTLRTMIWGRVCGGHLVHSTFSCRWCTLYQAAPTYSYSKFGLRSRLAHLSALLLLESARCYLVSKTV